MVAQLKFISLVPRTSHVFQRFTRKIGKAWSILLCNDNVLDAVWAAVSYLRLLARARSVSVSELTVKIHLVNSHCNVPLIGLQYHSKENN